MRPSPTSPQAVSALLRRHGHTRFIVPPYRVTGGHVILIDMENEDSKFRSMRVLAHHGYSLGLATKKDDPELSGFAFKVYGRWQPPRVTCREC